MKTGLIAFPFAYLQLLDVKTVAGIVFNFRIHVVQDFCCVGYLGAPLYAAGVSEPL